MKHHSTHLTRPHNLLQPQRGACGGHIQERGHGVARHLSTPVSPGIHKTTTSTNLKRSTVDPQRELRENGGVHARECLLIHDGGPTRLFAKVSADKHCTQATNNTRDASSTHRILLVDFANELALRQQRGAADL
jgi:hypothetical protein